MNTIGYIKDLLATPSFLVMIWMVWTLDLNRCRSFLVTFFCTTFCVDFIFSLYPDLHNEPLAGQGHWGLGVILAAGVVIVAALTHLMST